MGQKKSDVEAQQWEEKQKIEVQDNWPIDEKKQKREKIQKIEKLLSELDIRLVP